MKANRKDTKSVLIDLAYKGSMNEFEEFYGFAVTYQELEQQSYIEFKEIMFESINSKIKFRKYGRIGNVLTVRAEMYEEEIELFENLIQNNKIKTIYDWIVRGVTMIKEEEYE
tara:strand:+ start:541 stop:879 length:339 start_codon:yes stop_codon:yes gene_type:complete